MNRVFRLVLAAGACLVLAAGAQAQQAEEFGEYIVHYNTLNTNLLPPDVARAYGIQRAGTRALLNIAVVRKDDRSPVHARIRATAVNLTGQRREIDMREIVDQEAIYYIGQFRVHNEETLDFSVEVRPRNGETGPLSLRFRQQFFTD